MRLCHGQMVITDSNFGIRDYSAASRNFHNGSEIFEEDDAAADMMRKKKRMMMMGNQEEMSMEEKKKLMMMRGEAQLGEGRKRFL